MRIKKDTPQIGIASTIRYVNTDFKLFDSVIWTISMITHFVVNVKSPDKSPANHGNVNNANFNHFGLWNIHVSLTLFREINRIKIFVNYI